MTQRGGFLIAWDQDLVWVGAVVLKTYCLSLEVVLRKRNTAFSITAVYGPTYHVEKEDLAESEVGHSLTFLTLWCIWKQRHARIFRWTMKAEHALFVEIKDTCQLWSLAGGVFSKPLFVAQISNM